jgi:hypothetical protein
MMALILRAGAALRRAVRKSQKGLSGRAARREHQSQMRAHVRLTGSAMGFVALRRRCGGRRTLLLLRGLLPCRFVGTMPAHQATDAGTDKSVMTGNMPCRAADCGTLEAAFGLGGRRNRGNRYGSCCGNESSLHVSLQIRARVFDLPSPKSVRRRVEWLSPAIPVRCRHNSSQPQVSMIGRCEIPYQFQSLPTGSVRLDPRIA